MTEITTDAQLTYAEKIAKLLRKAEATDNAHEAEALFAKAQELMVSYAIDEELIAKARGVERKDAITQDRIEYTGIFQAALFNVGQAVASANNCKCLISKETWTKPTKTVLHLVGFESDIERVKMLDSSVQLQCAVALKNWWASDHRAWMSKMEAFKAKREFIFGFASGLSSKLHEAKRAGEREAAKNEAARSHVTQEEASTSVALVLRTRQEQVKDWYDQQYGGKTRSVSRNYQSGGAGARNAGYSAGRSANTGTTGIGGDRKSLGR